MKLLLILLVFGQVEFSKLPPESEGSFYEDIMAHAPTWPPFHPFGGDAVLKAHETSHAINVWHHGLYVGRGKMVYMEEIPLTVGDVMPYIPQRVKEMDAFDYRVYFIDKADEPAWEILDEWVAYVNDARVSLDGDDVDVRRCITFSIYGVCLGMAVRERAPEYWRDEPQFRNFVAWQLVWSQQVYEHPGKVCRYVEWLRTSEDAGELRGYLEKYGNKAWGEKSDGNNR